MEASAILKSVFFVRMKRNAISLLSNPVRLHQLFNLTTRTANQMRNGLSFKAEFSAIVFTFGRLMKAVATGAYRDISYGTLAQVVATLIYFVSPVDVIPDFIPFSGFVDDFTILIWVFNSLKTEFDKFLSWEKASQPHS